MKRALLGVALLIASLTAAGSSAAVHPKVTRAQAVEQLGRMLGAEPKRVHLLFADERTTDVVLEWAAYSPHARIRVLGGPVGIKVPRYYRGPAVAWLSANGQGRGGLSSLRPPRGHHILPLRSTSIPLLLVRALWQDRMRVRLTPLRVHPTIGRVEAIRKLRQWGGRHGLEGIWLVHFRRGGGGKLRLAWMAVGLHLRVPILGGKCKPGEKCKLSYTAPVASFVGARSGKFIMARTINGWKPQLPPG